MIPPLPPRDGAEDNDRGPLAGEELRSLDDAPTESESRRQETTETRRIPKPN